MITFGLNYEVKKEYTEQFLEITNKVLEMMPSLEGHVSTKLYSDVNQPNSYLIYSEWETDANFKNFVTSQAFKDVQNMSSDMLEARPKHKIYETKKMGH
jgi:heme-degrading monooxygenase HmoA